MHSNPFLVPTTFVWLSIAGISPSQETVKEPIQAEAEQDVSKQVLGYWVIDFDSAETKTFLADMSDGVDAADFKNEMDASTFEFKPEQMVLHQPDETSLVKISVKSQDLEKRILVTEFQTDNDEPVPTTLQIKGDQLILTAKETVGEDRSLGLKRIDEETFKKRVPEVIEKEEPVAEPNKKAIGVKDGYPVAAPVPDKPGFVFSPYNELVVDVTDIPSGTLVADPQFSSNEKKYFRVP